MSTNNPLVSAVIPTHNRADLLPRALHSVVNQTYDPLEIIVVDDGSTDETSELIKKYKSQYQSSPPGRGVGVGPNLNSFNYIRNEKSQGASAARNKGIKAAQGTFIAGLDDDDEWHKDRITELVAAYSDEYACVTSDTNMVYSHGRAVWRKKKKIELNTLLYTNQVGNQVLAKRERLLAVGCFDEQLEAAQDYDLWLRLCDAYGPVRNVQKPLQTIYVDHAANQITDRSFRGYLQFYQKHKHRMDRKQRKYQLYKIRRAQNKPIKLRELLNWVPAWRYFKETKQMVAGFLWK